MNNLDTESRLNKMLSILDGKRITADMITLDLLETFIYRIIVIDRKSIVITINAFNSLSLEDLRVQRKETVKREPLYVCLKDIHIDNVRIFGQGVRKFVQLNLYTAL